MSDTRSRPPRSNWNISQRTSQSAGLYAVALVDLEDVFGGVTRGISESINTGLATLNDLAFTEFAFNVNPKSLGLEEPAAVTIVPTQDGQYVEHQGQIYKNVSVAGTTGLRPNRKLEGAIIPIAGIANPFASLGASEETGLPPAERTGFDDLIDLRNVFRRYWDLKRDTARASTTVMVWQNGKEGEYYIVEPTVFKTDRDASSPLTFTYTMQLKTIERLDVTRFKQLSDSFTNLNSPNAFFSRISDIRRQLTAAFTIVQSLTDRTVTLGQRAINDVLSPVNDVIQGLSGIITSGRRAFDIPRNSLSIIATSSTELATAIDNMPNNAYVTDGITSQLSIISNAYKKIGRQLRLLAVEDQLFTTQLSTTVNDKRQAYRNPITGMPKSGGSPTDLSNAKPTNAASIAVINGGEDIRAISKRLLGDAAKWKILVLLNNLKPPYIAVNGDGKNVLKPGQQILFPRASADTTSPIPAQELRYTSLSPIDQRLGRDWRLQAISGAGGEVLYDIAVASSGDVDTVVGIPNMVQACVIKFAVEQGELPTHPFFGIRAPIGSKARIASLVAFQLNARATFLSDRRVASIERMQFALQGNVLQVQAAVGIKGFDQSLALDFTVRR